MALAFLAYVHGRTVPVSFRTVLRSAYLPALVMLAPAGLAGFLLADYAERGWLQLIFSGGIVAAILLVGGLWKVSLPAHRNAVLGHLGLNCTSGRQ